MRIVVPAVVAVLALAACGSDDTTTSTAGGGTDTDLTFRLDPDGPGGAEAQEATVTCPGGDEEACATIDVLPDDPAAPTPSNQACTEVYGGPDTLTVNGTLRGETVAGAFDRTNGCEIQRFDQFADVLAVLFPEYKPGSALSP